LLLWPIDYDRHDCSFGGDLSVNRRYAPHSVNLAPDTQCRYLERESVAGHDRPSEFCFFDTGEEWDLGIAVFKFAQGQDRSYLRQSLDLQYAGHHRCARKMAGEKRLVDRDLFDADYTHPRLELDDAVDQQKRVPVGQYLLYRYRVHDDHIGNDTKIYKTKKPAGPKILPAFS
jgi:hypothetical protein